MNKKLRIMKFLLKNFKQGVGMGGSSRLFNIKFKKCGPSYIIYEKKKYKRENQIKSLEDQMNSRQIRHN